MDLSIYKGIAEIERNHWWYKTRRDIIVSILSPILHAGERRILSVGCGVGGEVFFLKQFGKIYGIDVNETAIEYCKKAGLGDDVMQANAESIPFGDNTFDIVFILDVLEHVRDDKKAMREIYRVLKKDGLLVLTVPALPFLWTRADERAHHFRRYTRGVIEKRFLQSDFSIRKISYFNFILFLPIALVKIATRIFEPKKMVGKEVSIPRPFLNNLLYWIFKKEAWLLKRINLPIGISIFCVGQK